MNVTQNELETVEGKLNKQNALKAAIACSFWCIPLLITWYFLFQMNGQIAPIFLIITGALVGALVRFHGKGYTALFSGLAVILHALLVLSAFLLDLVLAPGETIWAVVLLGTYVFGAYLALIISRIQIPFHEHKAYYQLAEVNEHVSAKKLKNRWFIALPISVLLSGSFLIGSTIVLYAMNGYLMLEQATVKAEQKRETFEDKAISLDSAMLKSMSTKNALIHAYAFYSGQLSDEYGYFKSRYPKSTYKTNTILKFLVETRDNARAKFLLGSLTLEDNGLLLIREAANKGDIYAKIYVALQFACNGKADMATDLLTRLKGTTRDKLALKQIDKVFSIGFEDACNDKYTPPFLLEHARSYSD